MKHSIEQLQEKCTGLSYIVQRLKVARKEGEDYLTLCHLIDSLVQQWEEIDHEVHLQDLIKAAGEIV